jgi:hypothetical protein
MRRKKSTDGRQYQARSYRLSDETLEDIVALVEALRAETGNPVSQTDVIRLAIRELHRKKVKKSPTGY